MDFLNNHYEKIILSVVLLGVVFFASLLPGRIKEERDKLEGITREIEHGAPKLVKEIDLAPLLQNLKREQNPPPTDISGQHNLFNPVRWQQRPDGSRLKLIGGDEFLRDFIVTAIRPLNYTVTFDGPKGPADALRYYLTFTDEGAPTKGEQRPKIRSFSTKVDDKNDLAALREITGPPNNPTALVVELLKEKERITLGQGKEKSYHRLVAYEADAKYDPENKTYKGLRANPQSTVQFAGDNYKVIAITETTVTIEAVSTGKRTTKQLAANP